MAIAIDSSTIGPTSISQSLTSVTSATFSPPANSVVFVFFAMTGPNVTASQTVTSVSDSLGSHLGWALYAGSRDNIVTQGTITGTTEVWWAACPSAQTNMTVTGNFAHLNDSSGTNPAGVMQIIVFTGASSTQSGSASIRNSIASGTPSLSLTTSASNSWVFGIFQNWTNSTAPTDGSNQTNTFNGQNVVVRNTTDGDAFWVQATNSTTASSGTVVTLNDTAPTNIAMHISMVEVLAGPGAATIAWLT